MSLAKARKKKAEARELLHGGIDPAVDRAAQASEDQADADTFERIAREWFEKNEPRWVPSHSSKIIRRLEANIFPWIGREPINTLTAAAVLATLRRIESRGRVETAHRTMQNCSQIFRYAVATGRAERDPTQDLRGALPPTKQSHFASVREPKEFTALLRAIDGFTGTFTVKTALQLAPLVFVRPGELRGARWAEIDLDTAEWRIPAERMNKRAPARAGATDRPWRTSVSWRTRPQEVNQRELNRHPVSHLGHAAPEGLSGAGRRPEPATLRTQCAGTAPSPDLGPEGGTFTRIQRRVCGPLNRWHCRNTILASIKLELNMEATTLSSKYQLVIPRAIRERMNLQPGQKFQTLQIGNRIELLPLESPQQARGFLKGIQTNVPREPDRA